MNKILEYQKLDLELNKLKKSNLNSVEKSNMNKLKGFIVEAHDKGVKLENDASDLLKDYENLKKQYDSNSQKIQKLINKDLNTVELDDVDNILSTINSLSSELFLLERNINIIITKIKSSLKEFETTKNNMIKARTKYNEFKVAYEKSMKLVEPKLKEIEDKMKALEGEIDSQLLNKYKTMKADKIFPVYVSFDNGHCSGCRVEIPTARVNKLKNEGTIVCEQCHRIIYMK